jgi:type I restriction enzyme M protein
MDNISSLQADLWEAADQLRANGNMPYNEYFMPVMGIIFLRHAANRFEAADKQIQADRASGAMKRSPVPADYRKRRALFLPEKARYDFILSQAKDIHIGKAIDDAMTAIENDFPPLKGVVPRDYIKVDAKLLEDLMKIFNRDTLRQATGDIFGRIYEYFLMKFSMEKAHDNGEFFTPPSLVQTLVNVIEPGATPPFDSARGITVLDPASGSGGMFVQTSHFVEALGFDTAHRVTFYGHEKTATTIRLAKMNLAVHGLEGDIQEANTFYSDPHTLVGKCDFVMANPPFNVDKVDAAKAEKDTRRLPFGLPGINKAKHVSNANYLWISYFWSYLSPKGRAGFVMSSQASGAGNDEKEVRRKIVETGDVDVMISIRSNFFYTRSVPCELWHFDRAKPKERRDKVLMLDARNIYRQVTRKIFDFSPEQLQNIAAIIWLYRGQSDRFIALVQQYLQRTLTEAAAIAAKTDAFRAACGALADATAPFLKSLPPSPAGRGAGGEGSPLRDLMKERDDAAKACFQSVEALTKRISKDWKKPCEPKLAAQKKFLTDLDALATSCCDIVKNLDLVFKLATRTADAAADLPLPKGEGRGEGELGLDTRPLRRLAKDLDACRKEAVDQLKATSYFERQVHWLLSRFPDAKLVAVPGLVKLVDLEEIEAADWSLTPGRYVGVPSTEVDEDFDFEQAITNIRTELADLNQEAVSLAKRIQNNLQELGA